MAGGCSLEVVANGGSTVCILSHVAKIKFFILCAEVYQYLNHVIFARCVLKDLMLSR